MSLYIPRSTHVYVPDTQGDESGDSGREDSTSVESENEGSGEDGGEGSDKDAEPEVKDAQAGHEENSKANLLPQNSYRYTTQFQTILNSPDSLEKFAKLTRLSKEFVQAAGRKLCFFTNL